MKKLFFGLSVLAAFVLSGCLKSNSNKEICKFDPCAYKAPDAQIQAVQHYIDSVGVEATRHCSGIFYAISDTGSGNKVEDQCATIVVRYKGTLADGTEFDSNYQFSQNQLQPFALGNLIPGWKIGLTLIKKGGSIRLYIPPYFAYGTTGQDGPGVDIPPNAMLIFDIQLLDVY